MCIRDRSTWGFIYKSTQMASPRVNQVFFAAAFAFIELTIIFLYGFCSLYPSNVTINPTPANPAAGGVFSLMYPFYMDIHVMVFIGFAFLLAYIRSCGWTAVGVNFIAAVITVQVYILFRGFWLASFTGIWTKIPLDFTYILTADYAVMAVIITWGALVGRLGPTQTLLIAILEAFIYSLNERICYDQVSGMDLGGSATVFLFGGTWGLFAGLVNPRQGAKGLSLIHI
eukprot:TRINITY_DN3569_c0_g1_i4.p1 TRINITY_DN3569_c0_g1~~TRINITY_DN3569_c0_g1_i4.p1  ORF type:complete len:248 (-),score=71.19 TRINITY_DN3569_c0_g1_i4:62-745(-)